MGRIKKCRQCGVPLGISRDLVWHGNGVITQARDPGHRMVFFEASFLDELFAGLEKLTSLPVEHMVIESKRRRTREYMEKQISPLTRKILHRYGPNYLSRRISGTGRHYGYGDIVLKELRSRNDDEDYQVVSIRHPYSLPLFCGDSVGSKEAMDGRDFAVSWEETGDHEYVVTFRVGEHPLELRESLHENRHNHKPGDLKYKRCSSCGVPLGVARCLWDLDAGTILDPGTGRRMAIYSPDSIEAILEDIEAELESSITEIVIDEQRRFVRKMLGREDPLIIQPGYREMTALRGLGYLRRIDVDEKHCTVLVENPCLPLFTVGIIQALFEMGTDHDNVRRDWEILHDGDLLVELSV